MFWLTESTVSRKKREEKLDTNQFVVRGSKMVRGIGLYTIILSCVFLIPMWIFRNENLFRETDLWATFPLFLIALISGLFLFVNGLIWKMEINENRIYYRSILGGTKVFDFDEIEKVKAKKTAIQGESKGRFPSITAYSSTYSQISLAMSSGKLLTVHMGYEGFFLLVVRLEQEELPFEFF